MTREEMLEIFKATKDKMAKGVKTAGELLNPVTAVKGYGQMMEERSAAALAERPGITLEQEVEARLPEVNPDENAQAGAGGPASDAAPVGDEGMTQEEIDALAGQRGYIRKKNDKDRLQKALDQAM